MQGREYTIHAPEKKGKMATKKSTSILTESSTSSYEVQCDTDGKAVSCVKEIAKSVYKDKELLATGRNREAISLESFKEEMQEWL